LSVKKLRPYGIGGAPAVNDETLCANGWERPNAVLGPI